MSRSPAVGRRALIALGLAVLAGAWIFSATLLWRTDVPSDLTLPDLDASRYFSADQLNEASSYETFLRVDFLLASLAQLVALGLFAVTGARFARESAAGRIGTGMLLGMLGLAFVWIAQFPFDLAALWWQRRHEVSEQGYIEWALNDFLTAGGEFLFISLALLIVMALAGLWRRRWWLAAAPALLAVLVAFGFVQPYLLPDLDPLHDSEIAADAERLGAAQGIPDPEVHVQDTLDLTNAPNAGALGIGPSERVILWDTLLESFERPEVGVVLAHEFGHLSRNHIWKGLAWWALLALPIGLIAHLATRRRGGMYEPAAVPLAVFVIAVALFATSPLQHAYSQRLEAEADWIALETTRDPGAATELFRGFTEAALEDPDSPFWAEILLDDHPSVMERIEMGEAWRARS